MGLSAQDYVELQELYSRSTRLITDGDAAGWVDLFTDDAVFAMPAIERFGAPPMELRGKDALRAYMDEVVGGAFDARMGLSPNVKKRYVTTNVSLRSEADGEASGSAYFFLVVIGDGEPRLFGSGTYTDRFVKTDAGWRIRHRMLTPDA